MKHKILPWFYNLLRNIHISISVPLSSLYVYSFNWLSSLLNPLQLRCTLGINYVYVLYRGDENVSIPHSSSRTSDWRTGWNSFSKFKRHCTKGVDITFLLTVRWRNWIWLLFYNTYTLKIRSRTVNG